MPQNPSRKKIEQDQQQMIEHIQIKEDIRSELRRREDGDGEELGATGVRSQGKLQSPVALVVQLKTISFSSST